MPFWRKDKNKDRKGKGKAVGENGEASQSVTETDSVGGPSPFFTKEVVGLFPTEDKPPSDEFNVDIVAVHGLGGHYQTTWTAGTHNWLRDFLPGQLRSEGINPRIMCYGYDASTAFSKSVLGIHNVAEDFLDRLRLKRRHENEKKRPIILMAHGLGGLIIKKAINTTWEDQVTFGPLLEKIHGLIFFGVPHRGADIAYWTGLPAALLDHALIGCGGNRSFLKSLEKNSPEWRTISRSFVQRGAAFSMIRTFYETEKMGNLLIVDEDSARLMIPNERCTAVAKSNHRTMVKFEDIKSEKYEPVWGAILEMAENAIAGEPKTSRIPIMISADPPLNTQNFYGRVDELKQMREFLKPGLPERTALVLWGLGSFGKTQLALRYQSLHSKHYTSQIWVRPSSFKSLDKGTPSAQIVLNLDEYKESTSKESRDLLPYSKIPFHHVKARLEVDVNKHWLLILDDTQDLIETYRINEFIPQCAHGTIILITNRSNLASSIPGARGIEVGKIGLDIGAEMFLQRFRVEFPESHFTEEMTDLSKQIVESLDGSPLAIEQASAYLSSRGPLSVGAQNDYLDRIKNDYSRLMSIEPGPEDCYYDKENKSIVGTFNLLESDINKANPEAIMLLTLSSFLDTSCIRTEIFDDRSNVLIHEVAGWSINPSELKLNTILTQFKDPLEALLKFDFPKALMTLRKFCCVKVQLRNTKIFSFGLEGAISRWCRGRLAQEDLETFALLSSYTIGALSDHIVFSLQSSVVSVLFERWLMAHVRTSDGFLAASSSNSKRVQGPNDPWSWMEFSTSWRFSKFYYLQKAFSEAANSIRQTIALEILLYGDSWLKTPDSLRRYHLMARIYRDCGELTDAGEAFVTLISASKELLGNDDPFVMEVASQAKSLWTQRANDEQFRRRIVEAGDRKVAVWSPVHTDDLPGYSGESAEMSGANEISGGAREVKTSIPQETPDFVLDRPAFTAKSNVYQLRQTPGRPSLDPYLQRETVYPYPNEITDDHLDNRLMPNERRNREPPIPYNQAINDSDGERDGLADYFARMADEYDKYESDSDGSEGIEGVRK